MTKSKYQARHRRACRPSTPLTELTGNIKPATGVAAVSVTGLALSVLGAGMAQAAGEASIDVTAKSLTSSNLSQPSTVKPAVNPAITAPTDVAWAAADELAVEAEAAPAVEEEETILEDRDGAAERGFQRFEPAPVATAGGVVGIAAQYIGVPYVWGGSSPAGFDCSGLVQYVYGQAGYSLPRTAGDIGRGGTIVSAAEAQPGDIVWYPYGHVGIYVGNGQMIHAPQPGRTVEQAPIFGSDYHFVRY